MCVCVCFLSKIEIMNDVSHLYRSISHAVGCGFAPRPSHTKDHYKKGTNCLPAWHAGFRVGISQCSPNV